MCKNYFKGLTSRKCSIGYPVSPKKSLWTSGPHDIFNMFLFNFLCDKNTKIFGQHHHNGWCTAVAHVTRFSQLFLHINIFFLLLWVLAMYCGHSIRLDTERLYNLYVGTMVCCFKTDACYKIMVTFRFLSCIDKYISRF